MKPKAYYNEFNKSAARWLREIIKAGHIADGDVDTRSITDVQPNDLDGYTQVHFFAGIGGWSYAMRLAGWPDDRPVWTGSCPCQPYSVAGSQEGDNDDRNLWPEMFRLIQKCRPVTVFGEQVEAAIGHGWLDGLSANLEGEEYAVGSVVLGAHSVGADHRRQRLFWVADSQYSNGRGEHEAPRARGWRCGSGRSGASGAAVFAESNEGLRDGSLADAASLRRAQQFNDSGERRDAQPNDASECSGFGRMANAESRGLGIDGSASGIERYADKRSPGGLADSNGGNASNGGLQRGREQRQQPENGRVDEQPAGSFWSDAQWLGCSDGKSRRVKPGIFPLAHGIPYRRQDPVMGCLVTALEGMGYSPKAARRVIKDARSNRVIRLSGAGNAIVPELAAEFIIAFDACA